MASNSKANTTKNIVQNDVHNVVLNGVVRLVEKDSKWSGTMTNLNSALVRVLSRKQREILPGSPGALRMVLNRVVNRIRNRSISVKFVRTNDHARTRLVRFMQ